MCFTIDTTPAKPNKKAQAYRLLTIAGLTGGFYRGTLARTSEGEYRTSLCARQMATLDISEIDALISFFYECTFSEIKQEEKWAYELFFLRKFAEARQKAQEQFTTVKKVAESSVK